MALQKIALKRDQSKVLDNFISDVLIQTNENLYSTNQDFNSSGANGALNFGYIPEAGCKIKLSPRSRALIDGSEFQRGYDASVEMVSIQIYSMYELEKFKNELCTINFHPLHIYVKDVYLQVDVEANFDKEGNSKVTITGKKFVNNIREFIDGNPWGSLDYPGSPWAFVHQNILPNVPVVPTAPSNVNASMPNGQYDFVSGRFESYRSVLTGLNGSGGGLGLQNL